MTEVIKATTVADAYYRTLQQAPGWPSHPSRLGPANEMLGFQVEVSQPRQNLIICEPRKFNYRYMIAETIWNMLNRCDISSLKKFSKGIDKFIEDQPDRTRVHWAYGPQVAPEMYPLMERLFKHRGTRRALLKPGRVHGNRTAGQGTPPCTEVIQFLERDGYLHCFVYMRSNDAFLGFPYDMFTFTTWQCAIARALDLKPGLYHHYAASMHLYAKYHKRAAGVLHEGVHSAALTHQPTMHDHASLMSAYQEACDGDFRGGTPTWDPLLYALNGKYDDMDPTLRVLQQNGHGVGW